MVDDHEPGKRIHLVRNPNWRPATDFKAAYLDEIDVREGNDNDVATARRVLRGNSLVTGDCPAPPSVVEQALERSRDQLARPSVNGGRRVSLNTRLEPLDDVNVRRAVRQPSACHRDRPARGRLDERDHDHGEHGA